MPLTTGLSLAVRADTARPTAMVKNGTGLETQASRRPIVPCMSRFEWLRTPCAVCDQRAGRGHTCRMKAIARKSRAVEPRYRTPAKRFCWEGWLRDRRGYLWRCGHDHFRQADARQCAARYLRQVQKGNEPLPHRQIDDSIDWMGRRPIRGMTDAIWDEMKAAADNRCTYCREHRPLVKEHATPLSRGGAHDVKNIVPACKPCNRRKGTMTRQEFQRHLASQTHR